MARAKTKKPVAKKAKPKAKKAKARTNGKAKHVAPVDDDDDSEPSDTELMLQTLACPVQTAERLAEICQDAVMRVKQDLTGIAAAELVWRKRPEREAVAVAVQGLATELERHGEVMVALFDQLRAIAEDDGDHGDLEIPDVIDRLKPLLNSLSPEE
jgi:hypothetical protein